eukprot:102540-Rhodomonas_salina.1
MCGTDVAYGATQPCVPGLVQHALHPPPLLRIGSVLWNGKATPVFLNGDAAPVVFNGHSVTCSRASPGGV